MKTINDHYSPADWALHNSRKVEILQLRSQGFLPPEIAEMLSISINTVKNQTRMAIKMLYALNVIHAIVIAIDLGIVDASLSNQR